jgi:hypothetical protein
MTKRTKFTESHDSAARESSSRTASGSRKVFTCRDCGANALFDYCPHCGGRRMKYNKELTTSLPLGEVE